MPENLLNLLKFCLLLLLYLFFFRVLRAVWSEINPAKAVAERVKAPARRAKARRAARGPATELVIAEPPEQRGRAFPLGDEITVGRAAGCQITLDDTFISQLHARVFTRDGQVMVEDLGSTNGTYLNRKKVTGPMVVSPGDHVQVGNTVLELA